MRYLIAVIDDQSGSATPGEMKAIDAFNEQLLLDGHWVLAAGLEPLERATVFDFRDGHADVIPGPLQATQEFMSGFWIIDASDDEKARQLAADASACCGRKVELRTMLASQE